MKKILLADGDKSLLDRIVAAAKHAQYEIETATTGEEVLREMDDFSPDLIYIDLLIPRMHGIEVIQKIRGHPQGKEVGIILTSTNSMIQNFHSALKEGIDFYLRKPFEIPYLYELISRYFAGELTPDPFVVEDNPLDQLESPYEPERENPYSYLHFWGTRGSNPVSGPEYVRFGGNTVCLEVRDGDDLVIIDGGTGIRSFGETLLTGEKKTIHIFLSHTHWDHVIGLPFFAPLYDPDMHLVIWSPVGFEKSTKELFTEMLAYSYFPVRLEDMKAKLTFKDLRDGHPVSVGGITIDSTYAFHPGATLCFKIGVQGKTIGYATDNEMFLGFHGNPNTVDLHSPMVKAHQKIIEFYTGCDLLIHEAQYTPLEYQCRVGWGHTSITNAALLCKLTKTKHWMVTHHDPKHTDEALLEQLQLQERVLLDCHHDCRVEMAFDGFNLPL